MRQTGSSTYVGDVVAELHGFALRFFAPCCPVLAAFVVDRQQFNLLFFLLYEKEGDKKLKYPARIKNAILITTVIFSRMAKKTPVEA